MLNEQKYDILKARNKVTGVSIPETEPVILFRAQDAALPAVLTFYERNLREIGASKDQILAVRELHEKVVAWQTKNLTKVPD